MHTLVNRQRGFAWAELAVCIVILLILTRFVWSSNLLEAENQFMESLGLEPWMKYLLVVPLFFLWLHWQFRRESRELAGTGKPVVRPFVLVFALISLGGIFVYFYNLASSG